MQNMSSEVVQENIKENCPAFTDGCPYAKLKEEHSLPEVKNCPAFQDGCPFKESKSIEEIKNEMSKMPEYKHHDGASHEQLTKMLHSVHELSKNIEKDKGKCPVFETESGCPFKNVESEGKPLIQPADVVMSQKDYSSSSPEELEHVKLSNLRETCPAFDKGCPYAQITELPKGVEKCPEFKDGCPFKEMSSMSEVYEKLSKIPAFNGNDSHGAKLLQSLKEVHTMSKELKEEMGECPVFANDGCPFKTVCSDGRPLIEKLEFRRWTEVLQMSVESNLMNTAEQVANAEPSIKLSKELKKGTKVVHRAAENVHFIKDFIKGKIQAYWYRVLVADLYFVYKALEEESRKNKDHPQFKSVHFPHELERAEALREDLEFYYGEDWQEQVEYSPATKKYVERLKQIGEEDPLLLIPHHYTRYLGDLSGGLILKKMATKAMDLPSTGEGVQFYCFKNVSEPKKFKNYYRSQLDGIKISQEMSDKIVEEANLAFLLNIEIFKEIDAKAGYIEEEKETKSAEKEEVKEEIPDKTKDPNLCPFATMAKGAGKQTNPHIQSQAIKPKESSSTSSMVLALLVAGIAVFVALIIFKKQ